MRNTQVIYLGNRSNGTYQRGLGVCAALLERNGIPMLSHRDHRSLGLVLSNVDATFTRDPDHHESDWYVANLRD